MGSTLHVFLPFGVSLPCDHGLNLAISLLCEDVINQPTNQLANCSFHRVGNLYGTLNVSNNKQLQQEITSVYRVVVLLLYYCPVGAIPFV